MPGSGVNEDIEDEVRRMNWLVLCKSLMIDPNRSSSSILRVSKHMVSKGYLLIMTSGLPITGVGASDITKLKANGYYTVAVDDLSTLGYSTT